MHGVRRAGRRRALVRGAAHSRVGPRVSRCPAALAAAAARSTRPAGADGVVGAYVWKTYAEVAELVTQVGSAFVHLNLAPANGDGLRLIGLYSKNRYEWVVCEQVGVCVCVCVCVCVSVCVCLSVARCP